MQEPVEFTELVAPLERPGQRIVGRGRADALAAFVESEEGTRCCATEALRRGRTNPAALFLRMIWNGDHRLRVVPAQLSRQELEDRHLARLRAERKIR